MRINLLLLVILTVAAHQLSSRALATPLLLFAVLLWLQYAPVTLLVMPVTSHQWTCSTL